MVIIILLLNKPAIHAFNTDTITPHMRHFATIRDTSPLLSFAISPAIDNVFLKFEGLIYEIRKK